MQWDESANAGFTSGKPWLPVHVNADLRTVKSQMADEQSLWHVYKQVLQLRKAYSVLRYGMFQPVTFEQKTLLAYLRQDNEQTILVIINFKKRRTRLALGSDLQRAGWKELLSTVENPDRFNDPGYIRVKGHEACILLRTQG
jgi:trehalose-6-phosphate hydrolase